MFGDDASEEDEEEDEDEGGEVVQGVIRPDDGSEMVITLEKGEDETDVELALDILDIDADVDEETVRSHCDYLIDSFDVRPQEEVQRAIWARDFLLNEVALVAA